MIKREWPQHWPDMLKEMDVLTTQGVSKSYYAASDLFLLPAIYCKHNILLHMQRRSIGLDICCFIVNIFFCPLTGGTDRAGDADPVTARRGCDHFPDLANSAT